MKCAPSGIVRGAVIIVTNLELLNAELAAPEEFIRRTDEKFYQQVLNVAKDIYEHRAERPAILLSGPSGSGKTTTAMTIEKILDGWGCETHTLSMDNYFKPMGEREKLLLQGGQLDLESPERVDIEYLNQQLWDIIDCKETDIPKYDFKASERRSSGRILKRKPGELVLIEGIHALNPAVITLPDELTDRIYVSVRTRIKTDDLILHPENIRLLRRMIRDKKFRNRGIEETLEMLDSVQAGEKKYIMPYKYRSAHDIDSFIAYEVGVYKALLMNELSELKNRTHIKELLYILDMVKPIEENIVPKTSLIREFIGNGEFHY